MKPEPKGFEMDGSALEGGKGVVENLNPSPPREKPPLERELPPPPEAEAEEEAGGQGGMVAVEVG